MLAVLGSCAVVPTPCRAVEPHWTGQVRLRSEGFDRTFRGQTTQWDVLQRTRLGVGLDVTPAITVFVQAQDSRL